MINSHSYQKVPSISQILKQGYFFKDFEPLQKALKPINKLKQRFNSINTQSKAGPADQKGNSSPSIPNPIEEVKELFKEYNKVEQVSMKNFRQINQENKQFASSYHYIKEDNNRLLGAKGQTASAANHQQVIAKDIGERNLFNPSPFLMKSKEELLLYLLQNDTEKQQHVVERKSGKYIKRLKEYSLLVEMNKGDKGYVLNKSFIISSSNRIDIETPEQIQEPTEKELNQIMKENKTIMKQIKIVNKSLTRIEDNRDGFINDIIKGHQLGGRYINKRERKGGSQLWNSFNRTSGISFFSPNKRRTHKIPSIQGVYHSDATENQSQSSSTRYNNNRPLGRSFRSPGISAEKSMNRTCLHKDSSLKMSIDEVYNSTKTSSLFNNDNTRMDIVNYFKSNSLSQPSELINSQMKFKSNQLVQLIMATKQKIKYADIKKKMVNVYRSQVPKQVKAKLQMIERLERKICSLDYDFCKCILTKKA